MSRCIKLPAMHVQKPEFVSPETAGKPDIECGCLQSQCSLEEMEGGTGECLEAHRLASLVSIVTRQQRNTLSNMVEE